MTIKIESWNGHEIRFVEIAGEWEAIAKDVAQALNYTDTFNLKRNVDAEEIHENPLTDLTASASEALHSEFHRVGKVTTISEPGIYEATFNSKNPKAVEFKRWVTHYLKTIRKQSGLEQYEMFRMMDKEHQKAVMAMVQGQLGVQVTKRDYIKPNQIANKAIANKYGFPKAIKKEQMTPEMLKERQPILEEAAQLTAVKEKYGLDFSVKDIIYKKYCQ
jgi:prophage antirepressor-like protein